MNEEFGMRNSEFHRHPPTTYRSRASSMGPSPIDFQLLTFNYSAESYEENCLEPCPIIPNSEFRIPDPTSQGAK
jgi:hypothetical protein